MKDGPAPRDVCVFAMYVQEYGPECHEANRNRVYISYLDSVTPRPTDEVPNVDSYIQPHEDYEPDRSYKERCKKVRTWLFHALLIGYLEHAAQRGFEKAHLWACPPEDRYNEYIFPIKPDNYPDPSTQSISKEPYTADAKALVGWYEKMLERAKERGCVSKFRPLYKDIEGLKSVTNFPLFEGDQLLDDMKRFMARHQQNTKRQNKKQKLAPPIPDAPQPSLQLAKQVLTRRLTLTARRSNVLTPLACCAVAQWQTEQGDHKLKDNFLVADLAMKDNDNPKSPGARQRQRIVESIPESMRNHEYCQLFESRETLLRQMLQYKRWEWNDEKRARYSTMMMLAHLGGPPPCADVEQPARSDA